METTAMTMFQQTLEFQNEFVLIKPVCDFFGINLQNQHRKLKNDPIFCNLWTKKSTDFGSGRK